MRGRDKDAQMISEANRAAAAGRLMLGEYKAWKEYERDGHVDLTALPRRQLKSGACDVKTRMKQEIVKFCRSNFVGMTPRKLAALYDEVKPPYGLRLPLTDFEKRYASIREDAKRGCPGHATVSFTLWGLQFEFAEDHLSKDLRQHVLWAREASDELKGMNSRPQSIIRMQQKGIAAMRRKLLAAVRASLISSHALLEAYFNGIGWEFLQTNGDSSALSERKRKFLAGEEGSLRKKVEGFPELIAGEPCGKKYLQIVDAMFGVLKPFRDSVAHPSPFSAPERFGGYDKLSKIYEADYPLAELTLTLTCDILVTAHQHCNAGIGNLPGWLDELRSEKQWLLEPNAER